MGISNARNESVITADPRFHSGKYRLKDYEHSLRYLNFSSNQTWNPRTKRLVILATPNQFAEHHVGHSLAVAAALREAMQ